MSVKVTIELPESDAPFNLTPGDLQVGDLVQWNRNDAEFYGGDPFIIVKSYRDLMSIKAPGHTWDHDVRAPGGFRRLPSGTKITWEVE